MTTSPFIADVVLCIRTADRSLAMKCDNQIKHQSSEIVIEISTSSTLPVLIPVLGDFHRRLLWMVGWYWRLVWSRVSSADCRVSIHRAGSWHLTVSHNDLHMYRSHHAPPSSPVDWTRLLTYGCCCSCSLWCLARPHHCMADLWMPCSYRTPTCSHRAHCIVIPSWLCWWTDDRIRHSCH